MTYMCACGRSSSCLCELRPMTEPTTGRDDKACPEPLCTTTLRHHTHTDADGRSWCCHPYPYGDLAPAAVADNTGEERRCTWCGRTDGGHDPSQRHAPDPMAREWNCNCSGWPRVHDALCPAASPGVQAGDKRRTDGGMRDYFDEVSAGLVADLDGPADDGRTEEMRAEARRQIKSFLWREYGVEQHATAYSLADKILALPAVAPLLTTPVPTGTHVVEALDVALDDVTSEEGAVSAKELLYALNDSGWYLTRRRPDSATTGRGDDGAVQRVLALADQWDTDEDARYASARIARSVAARALREAVAGGQGGPSC